MTVSEFIRPDRFALTVPDHWAKFDLSESSLAAARAEAMAAARSVGDRLDIDSLFAQARAINRAARRQGALWGAGTATLYDDGLFLGQVMVFAISPPAGEDFTLPMLSAALGASVRLDDQAPTRSITAVDLPHVGSAVRVTGLERTTIAPGNEITLVVVHTFVPVPGDERNYFLITGCSPNLDLRESVVDLFDAITTTFRFVTT